MRLILIGAVFLLAACGGDSGPANLYPPEALARFEQSCPPESAVCVCTWDRLTRTMTYEDYDAALSRFRAEGIMDTRVTRARTYCLERHRE